MSADQAAQQPLAMPHGRPAGNKDARSTAIPPLVERVFPIRLQVQKPQPPPPMAPEAIPASASNGIEFATALPTGKKHAAPTASPNAGSRLPRPQPEVVKTSLDAVPTVSVSTRPEERATSGTRHTSTRYQHVHEQSSDQETPLEDTQTYRCEDEPIHIPGAVQRYGALIALRETIHGIFVVRIVSENSFDVTGVKTETLFTLRCFTDLFSHVDQGEFIQRVRSLQANEDVTNLDVCILSLSSLLGAPIPLFCAIHIIKESGLVICEFERLQDVFSPTQVPTPHEAHVFPDPPLNSTGLEATTSEYLKSVTSMSKPLRAVSVSRKSPRPLGALELFSILNEIQTQLSEPESLDQLLDIIVGLVYELTGFQRVMVYQFDDNAAGSVISELFDPRATKDVYRGLHFPASDIPVQARQLYMLNTVRVLYDRDQDTARLICREARDALEPLDLKHSYLRAMSPVHLKYLANMGVRASMSISLMVGGKLWGLISCHNYGGPMRLSLPLRELCRGLGTIASSNIEKLLYLSRIEARRLLSVAPPERSPAAYLTSSAIDLLGMFAADFGFLVIGSEARTIGKLFAYSEAVAILQYVRNLSSTTIFATHEITKDCPALFHKAGFSMICGILVVPLAFSGADFLIFFRKGIVKEITWAGNPYEKNYRPGASYLEPRSSFARFSESVVGTSRKWTQDEVDSASVLSTLYGRFIETWRQKEAIVQQSKVTRLLIQNAGHEVRTPLNSIINYLEVALEDDLDEGARAHLQKSLEASKSLILTVNELLNLTVAEPSEGKPHENSVHIRRLISEVTGVFKHEAEKRSLVLVLEVDPDIPRIIMANYDRLRQVLLSILDNAVKSSRDGSIKTKVMHVSATMTHSLVEISVQDSGSGLSEQQLDSIFQDFEQVLDDEEYATVVAGVPGESMAKPVEYGVGVGLAIAARFVKQSNGAITMSSAGVGRGTKVTVSIPFRKALENNKGDHILELPLPTPPADILSHHLFQTRTSEVVLRPGKILPELPPQELIIQESPTAPASPGSPTVSGATMAFTPSISSSITIGRFPFPDILTRETEDHHLNILIAEDNPLNSRLLEMRLTKKGHAVQVAVDGQICLEAFKNQPAGFDAILMDIQMPLVDGLESTRLIRAFEKEASPPISRRATVLGRIPIIAISASMLEQSRHEYADAGFDGWMSKPINFKRLEMILSGIDDVQVREGLVYKSGLWENGGWFREPSGMTSLM